MKTTSKELTAEEVAALRNRKIDLSDIPEITEAQASELYMRNWKPRKQAVSVRIDMDILEWLKTPSSEGYQKRLNSVLRWAKQSGCKLSQLNH